MATKIDIVKAIYQQLAEPSDSSNYDSSLVGDELNNYVDRICKKIVISPATSQKYQAGDLPFLRKTQRFTQMQKVTNSVAIAVTDTEITLATTSLASSGALRIAEDVIGYWAKSSTQVTWVTNISVSHESGSAIYPLYPLPANITKPFTAYIVDSDGDKRELNYADNRYPTSLYSYYTVVVDDSNVEYFLFKGLCETDRVMINYYVNSTNMTSNSDVCTIPDPYSLTILPALVAWQLLWNAEEFEDAQTKFSTGFNALDEMYSFYNSQNEKNRRTVKVQNSDFSSIRGFHGTRYRNRIR